MYLRSSNNTQANPVFVTIYRFKTYTLYSALEQHCQLQYESNRKSEASLLTIYPHNKPHFITSKIKYALRRRARSRIWSIPPLLGHVTDFSSLSFRI